MSVGHLHLRVVSPERVVLETEADSLSLPGALGQLGILPGHAHLITALRTGVLESRRGNAVQKVAVFGGFAEVGEDTVTVLADSAALPDEIDIAAAHADRAAAEEALKTAGAGEIAALRERIDAAEARIATARRTEPVRSLLDPVRRAPLSSRRECPATSSGFGDRRVTPLPGAVLGPGLLSGGSSPILFSPVKRGGWNSSPSVRL